MNFKKIAILQSNYIPWKGYFDMINSVDAFILYDNVQYTKNDWRNRNIIKTRNGPQWITIPVKHFSISQKINETVVSNKFWYKKHINSFIANYSKAKFFKQYFDILKDSYNNIQTDNLSLINEEIIKLINSIIGIKTPIFRISDDILKFDKNERLIEICKMYNADIYLSGPAAKNYLDIDLFNKENIKVEWMDYSGYPEYVQLFPPFIHEVSILDLIFNTGVDSIKFMKKPVYE